MESLISSYKKNGFIIKRNLITDTDCHNIKHELDSIKTDMNIPFTNIQFGFGNLINHSLSSIITDNVFVKEFCKSIYNSDVYTYSSLYVHNKQRWVGPDIEWHQEVFNIDTFHPTSKKYSIDEIKEGFMQIYVALDDQNLENGCMKIIPYQDTVLNHYNLINTHFNHKRAIALDELDKIYKSHGILNLELKMGDVIFFNHLIPHSSSSNNSPFDRKAMVFLTYKSDFELDESIRENEKKYRNRFAISSIEKILEKKHKNDLYECGFFSKKK